MGNIYQNTPVTPVLSDQIALWQTANGDTRKSSLNEVLTLFQNNTEGCAVEEAVTQYYAPNTSGFTLLVNDDSKDTHLIMTPSMTLAVGAITLPTHTNLRDKQLFIVNTTAEITALTVNLNGATAIKGAPTTLIADAYFTLKYDKTLSTWYRIG